MKFAENNRISHRQLYRQIILSLAAPFLLCMSGKDWPYASGGLDDGNGLLGLVLALVVLGFYVVFLIRLEPYFGDLMKAAGGFSGRVIGAFFLVFVLLAGGYLLTVIADLVPVSLVTGISGNWIAFWAVLACGAGTCRGMQRRGRMAEVSGGFLLGGILLMMALCIPQGKAVYLEEMTETWHLSAGSVIEKMYGTLCAFSVIGLLPFALGDVEKYGSAGKAVTGGIITAGGILAGMKILMPAVLGMDRVRAEEYPVLPLLDGADLPGNVLARFDVLWMGFLLYSLLFALGSLMHYGHQIIRRAHLGTGRVWMAAVMWLLSQISIGGLEIRQYFLWYLSCIFLPGLLICQVYVYLRGRGRYRKKTAALSLFLVFSLFMGGCGSAVEPEKRMYPLAVGVDASAEDILVSYGMPDLSRSTGQGKEEEDGSTRVLQISGSDFREIEQIYDRSQEKFLDMGHVQVFVLGQTILEDGRWRMVLEYLKQEPFTGEDIYVFVTSQAQEVLKWQGENNSSAGEYITGLMENRMSEQRNQAVTLRDVFYRWYKEDSLPVLPRITVTDSSLEITGLG